jgi:hypothetical protein
MLIEIPTETAEVIRNLVYKNEAGILKTIMGLSS